MTHLIYCADIDAEDELVHYVDCDLNSRQNSVIVKQKKIVLADSTSHIHIMSLTCDCVSVCGLLRFSISMEITGARCV